MNKTALVCAIISLSLFLAGCGAIAPKAAAPTAVPSAVAGGPASPTPDPCSQTSLPETVKVVNAYMLQFDDKATIASNLAQSELDKVVPDMKGIQSSAQNQDIPSCLTDLKRFELLYMDAVIQTLVLYQTKPQAQALAAGILQARQYHDQYVRELARLTGIALPAQPNPSAATGAPSGGATTQPTVAATATTPEVVNPGPNPLNMHVSASLTSETVGVLNAGESAKALGKSTNGEWVLLEIPGQAGHNAWVYSSLVLFSSGGLESLPVAAP